MIPFAKVAENCHYLLPVEVPHDVLVGVPLVAHQGGVLDPKCGTNIKMPPLTGIFWCWFQVSRTQTDNFFPVRRL